ncbi:SMP-30/gluconolactonase/LRE family protein [Candidatus Latescibacterota bacterium]
MYSVKRKNLYVLTAFTALAVLLLSFFGCAKGPEWKAVNDRLISEHNIQVRERADLVETGITPSLEDGKVTNISTLPEVEFAQGVKGRMYWGKANLVNFMTMEPGAEISRETLSGERIMVMMKGTLEQLVNGQFVEMGYTEVAPAYYYSTGFVGHRDCLYLEKGTDNAVKAGPDGAEFVEIYYPIPLDYLEKAGAVVPSSPDFGNFNVKPNFPANQVFDYYDIQWTELVPGAYSKLINGNGVQVSLLHMLPGVTFDYHNHPEEQLMIVLRGVTDEFILDDTITMKEGDLLYLPPQMVHGGILSDKGCDAIDVFFPVRDASGDYYEKMQARRKALNAIIPEGEKPKLLAEGFNFTEGPVWLAGKLYFSSMFFDIPAGTWQSDPKKSDLIAMKSDGTWDYIFKGRMQTNGLMAKGNGNFVACDMAGHRIIEVSPSGRIVKTLASRMSDGTRLDGPNDIVINAKGGIYFTDPQFIFDEPQQPGKTVNYIKPNGEVIRIIEPGEFGMANGILLSPDGKTFYVNNTYHDDNRPSDVENWVIAYDVNDDGTLSNKRKFARLFLPPSEYELGTRSSCADGMTIDELGNIYVGTNVGLQIFNNKGEYIGNIHTPTFPVSACFGGENFDTIYMTCWDKIYSIKTKVKGLEYPLK